MKCSVKYFISFATVLIVFSSVFCFSSFAASSSEQTFSHSSSDRPLFLYKQANISTPNGTPDYGLLVDQLSPYTFEYGYLGGYSAFKSFNFQFSINNVDYDISSGNILKFSLNDISTVHFEEMDNRAYVKFRYRVRNSNGWQAWNDSGVTVTYNRDEYGEFLIDVDFFLDIAGLDLQDIQFELGIYSYNDINFYYPTVVFPKYATNIYNGSSSSPEAPKYSNPQTTVGGSVDEYKEKEDALMEDTKQGRDSLLSFFASFGDILGEFAYPLLAVSGAIMYFVDVHIVYRIILLSLILGLFAFVFNLGSSLVRSSIRSSERSSNSKGKGGGS
ncbi:MAG: hypothetical protein E7539_01120 [Ruminococcaceae bacterium]|nr:hypothetical protein [Oscillospiraceae bacterium]